MGPLAGGGGLLDPAIVAVHSFVQSLEAQPTDLFHMFGQLAFDQSARDLHRLPLDEMGQAGQLRLVGAGMLVPEGFRLMNYLRVPVEVCPQAFDYLAQVGGGFRGSSGARRRLQQPKPAPPLEVEQGQRHRSPIGGATIELRQKGGVIRAHNRHNSHPLRHPLPMCRGHDGPLGWGIPGRTARVEEWAPRGQRTGAPGPSGMPSHHQTKNRIVQLNVIAIASGSVKDASVPMPADLR